MKATKERSKAAKKPKVLSKAELKAATSKLGSCVLWALKFLDTKSGGGLVASADLKVLQAWEDNFMDALDGIGYVIDRKSYYENKANKGKRRSRRAS